MGWNPIKDAKDFVDKNDNSIEKGVDKAKDAAEDLSRDAWDGVKELGDKTGKAFGNAIDKDGLVDFGLDDIFDSVNGMWEKVAESSLGTQLSGAFNKLADSAKPKSLADAFGRLAEGAKDAGHSASDAYHHVKDEAGNGFDYLEEKTGVDLDGSLVKTGLAEVREFGEDFYAANLQGQLSDDGWIADTWDFLKPVADLPVDPITLGHATWDIFTERGDGKSVFSFLEDKRDNLLGIGDGLGDALRGDFSGIRDAAADTLELTGMAHPMGAYADMAAGLGLTEYADEVGRAGATALTGDALLAGTAGDIGGQLWGDAAESLDGKDPFMGLFDDEA